MQEKMPWFWRLDVVPMHRLQDGVQMQGSSRWHWASLSSNYSRDGKHGNGIRSFQVFAVEGNTWAAARAARLTPDAVQACDT